MTICDVCENKGPTTEREIAIRYPNQAATQITFDLCEKCEDILDGNTNPMLLGMKQLREREQSKPDLMAGWCCWKCHRSFSAPANSDGYCSDQCRASKPAAPPETGAYWRCGCPQCGKTWRISASGLNGTDPIPCVCGSVATWEKVEPVKATHQGWVADEPPLAPQGFA